MIFQEGAALIEFLAVSLAIMVLVTVVAVSIRWAANDARARGENGTVVGFLVFLTWPIGLVVWVLVRPPEKRLP